MDSGEPRDRGTGGRGGVWRRPRRRSGHRRCCRRAAGVGRADRLRARRDLTARSGADRRKDGRPCADHDAGKRQTAGRVAWRVAGVRRHFRLVRGRRQTRLWPSHSVAQRQQAIAHAANPGGRRRDDYGLELSGLPGRAQMGRRARCGLHRRRAAKRTDAAVRVRNCGRAGRSRFARRRAERRQRPARPDRRGLSALAARREAELHRLAKSRSAPDARRGRRHQAAVAGAWRQRAGDRAARRRRGRRGHALGGSEVPQQRPGLHLTQPLFRASRHRGRLPGSLARSDRAAGRRRRA